MGFAVDQTVVEKISVAINGVERGKLPNGKLPSTVIKQVKLRKIGLVRKQSCQEKRNYGQIVMRHLKLDQASDERNIYVNLMCGRPCIVIQCG